MKVLAFDAAEGAGCVAGIGLLWSSPAFDGESEVVPSAGCSMLVSGTATAVEESATRDVDATADGPDVGGRGAGSTNSLLS